MLAALPDEGKGFRFDKVREDALTYTGALRTAEGQNVIEPSPESSSMVIGLRASIDFLTAAPKVVKQLVDWYEMDQVSKKTPSKPVPDADEPEKAENKAKEAISLDPA